MVHPFTNTYCTAPTAQGSAEVVCCLMRKVGLWPTLAVRVGQSPTLRALCIGLGLASPAAALEVPSGQPVALQEVLVDNLEGGETWLRFRFVMPEIARGAGGVDYDIAGPDMAHLCETLALPYVGEHNLAADMIVISLSDRATEFGVADPEATQIFEAFRPVDNACIWEGL